MTEPFDVTIRAATDADAQAIVSLVSLLGHCVEPRGTRHRLNELTAAGIEQLVAVRDDRVVGVCGLHQMTAIHRNHPVGRITILVVEEDARGRGIGRRLLDAAEEYLARSGCSLIEVTSNDALHEAHRFYEQQGYERTSRRFAKTLV